MLSAPLSRNCTPPTICFHFSLAGSPFIRLKSGWRLGQRSLPVWLARGEWLRGGWIMALTRRQKQVLDFLVGFINDKGYSPSFEEIGAGLDLSSLATVHKHMQTLEKKGFIRRGYNQSRSVEVVAMPSAVPFGKTAVNPFAGPKTRAQKKAAFPPSPR